MELIIREATLEDLEQLSGLMEQLCGALTNIEKMKESYGRMMEKGGYRILVAELNSQLVGTVMGIQCEDLVGECHPFMVLENMIVDERSRGYGVGRKLIEALEKLALEQRCGYIMFVSRARRKEAHAFYEAVGYKKDVVQGFKKYLLNHE